MIIFLNLFKVRARAPGPGAYFRNFTVFRRPETEGTLYGGGSKLRKAKLTVLSSVIRVSF